MELAYPASTSLLPVTVTLAEFFKANGFLHLSFLGGLKLYPYWYLGTPFAFLTGPVTPLLWQILSSFGLGKFTAVIALVIMAQLLAVAGVFWLTLLLLRIAQVKQKNAKLIALGGALLVLANPWVWVSALGLAEGSLVLGWVLVPWTLAFGIAWAEKICFNNFLKVVLTASLLVLTNTTAYFVALTGILLWTSIKGWLEAKKERNEAGDWEKHFNWFYVKQFFRLTFFSFLISLFWYGPAYWLNLIFAGASIGGRSLFLSAFWVADLLKMALPVLFAVWAVSKWSRSKNIAWYWIVSWLAAWGFLSFARFLADWDFWQDWSQYGLEVSLGMALLVSFALATDPLLTKRWLLVSIIVVLVVGWVLAATNHFWWPRKSLAGSLEAKTAKWVQEINQQCQNVEQDCPVWFFSGTPVFWINALYPEAKQLRGGADQGSTNRYWRDWAWLLRESSKSNEVKKVIRESGIDYVLIHGDTSQEFYHDFHNLEIWEEIGEVVKSDQGDYLYKVGL